MKALTRFYEDMDFQNNLCIVVAILVLLIGGVLLLTLPEPEPHPHPPRQPVEETEDFRPTPEEMEFLRWKRKRSINQFYRQDLKP